MGYRHKRLLIKVFSGIYECNSGCPCSGRCLNRVAQLPSAIPLQLFMTQHKGWGVRTLYDIPRGTYVCIYTGEIITSAEANRRGKVYADKYLAELDHIEVLEKMKEGYESEVCSSFDENDVSEIELSDSDNDVSEKKSSDPDFVLYKTVSSTILNNQIWESRLRKRNKDVCFRHETNNNDIPKSVKSTRLLYGPKERPYIVDSLKQGNIARFLNHSCDPNMFVQTVFIDHHDQRFPYMAFFTSELVAAGTELTWDYNYDLGSDKKIKCYCGSKYCRGWLV